VTIAVRPGPDQRASLYNQGISAKDFDRFSRLIYSECGIKMPPHKRSMLEARMRKRLRALDFTSYEQYSDYFFNLADHSQELVQLIDEVTTNKTDFFREPAHFDFLTRVALPQLIDSHGAGIDRPLRLWSAGCSSGEEPYTLAMVLSEFAEQCPGFRFDILGTDISTKVLDKARLAIYRSERIEPVPLPLRKKYLLRSKNPEQNQVRIIPELRQKVNFHRLNFMGEDFGIDRSMDIIFCRNVIIYFDRPTQQRLLQRFCKVQQSGQFLFMGHSETLSGMDLPLKQMAPAVYRRF
jgi:chemotaxis protein methyltransferase CheR